MAFFYCTHQFEKALENNDIDILTAIVTIFHDNLKVINTSNWQRWMQQYVDTVLKGKTQIHMYNLLRWNENHLKTSPDGFWGLNWQKKVTFPVQ